jgi:aspartate/methionine/tyrosine aminotransferase
MALYTLPSKISTCAGEKMKLRPFLLDQWLQQHAEPPVEFNLGSSTGPHWKLQELLELAEDGADKRVLDTDLVYSRTAGGIGLREAIAEMQAVPAEQVVVLGGAAEALFILFFLAAEPGANVIVPFPCFPPHQAVPESLGLEVRSYHLRRENSYQIDLDEVKQLANAKTKIILVNSPHNPTGATLSDGELKTLHDFAVERGIQFVSDEVYHPIYHGRHTVSAARLPNATVIGDFSKAFSLSGLRLGWAVERNVHKRKQYLNTREYITISNTPMAEFLAEIAEMNRLKVWARAREEARINLQLLDALIGEHRDILEWVRPQGGMTGFPRLVSGANTRAFCQAAVDRGLLLAPGDCWDVGDHFRIGFGVGREWFPRAMERLGEFLHSWARTPHPSLAA